MKAIVYGAESADREKQSVDDQQRLVAEAIEREGEREVVGTFGEAGKSGYHGNRGPQLEAAINAATAAASEDGEAELWVFISSRLGRGTGKKGGARALGALLYELRAKGIVVRSVSDDAFTTNEQLWGIVSSMASKYSEDLGANVGRGIAKRKADGKAFGGVPIGYRREHYVVDNVPKTRRVIDPAGMKAVEAIFTSVEAGESWRTISKALNARGLRTQRGNPWTATAVRDVARNPIYRGEKGYPPALSTERFDRVQALLDSTAPAARQRRQGGRPPKDATVLLRGMAFCADCGEPMYALKGGRGQRYYVCRGKRGGRGLCSTRHVPARLADERVLAHLDTFIDSVEGWIAGRVAESSEQRALLEQQVRQQQAALGALEKLRDKLLAEYERQVEAGKSTADLALSVVERKDGEIAAQQEKIEQAQARLSEWSMAPDADAALDYYRELCEAIQERKAGATSVAQVNAVLSTIVAGIWLRWDGKTLEASFALRPLDGNDTASDLAIVLSEDYPEERWPLEPKDSVPHEGQPAKTPAGVSGRLASPHAGKGPGGKPGGQPHSTRSFSHLAIPPLREAVSG